MSPRRIQAESRSTSNTLAGGILELGKGLQRILGCARQHDLALGGSNAGIDDGVVRHLDPNHIFRAGSIRHTYPIVTILGRPVCVFNNVAISEITAEAFLARQMIEPLMQRRIRIASVQIAPPSWKRQKAPLPRSSRPAEAGERSVRPSTVPCASLGWTDSLPTNRVRCTFR